jgi:hypothetical protein
MTQSGKPFSASVVMALCRPSWNLTPGNPAALRIDRQAVRHDAIGFVGSSRLFRSVPREDEMVRFGRLNATLPAFVSESWRRYGLNDARMGLFGRRCGTIANSPATGAPPYTAVAARDSGTNV